MTLTTTIEVRAVVTVVESPGQTGARQADGAPLEPSFEREAHIQSVELPDAEGAGLRWRKEMPTVVGYYIFTPYPETMTALAMLRVYRGHDEKLMGHMDGCWGEVWAFFEGVKNASIIGPIGHATPAHLPVESLSPTDAQRLLRLAEREEV